MQGADARRVSQNYYDAFLQWLGTWGGETGYDPARPQYIEQGYMRNGDVYAVVNQIATKSAAVPFSIRQVKDKTTARQFKSYQGSKLRGDARARMELKILGAEAYDQTPMELPFSMPNPHQSWVELIHLYSVFWNTCGEVYLYWTTPNGGPNAGKPAQLFVLPSHLMQIVVKQGWQNLAPGESPVAYYQLIHQEFAAKFPAERVMHVTMSNPQYDYQGRHLYGMSPLMSVWSEIMAGNEGNANNLRMQKSGGAIGFLHGKREVLEEDQAKQLRDRIVEMRNDPTAMAQIAGISMDIGFTRVALDPHDMQTYANQQYVQKKICNALGWSDKLLNNDEGAKYDNMTQAYKAVITNKLMPDLNQLEVLLTQRFLPLFGNKYKNAAWVFHYQELPELQEDIKEQVEWILPLIREAVITRREGRMLLNLKEDPNPLLDVYTANVNTLPLADAMIPNLDGIDNGQD